MTKKIGRDEFCLQCMEWREYDENGRCKVCKHIICKDNKKQKKEGYNEYKTEVESFEIDEEVDIDDGTEY